MDNKPSASGRSFTDFTSAAFREIPESAREAGYQFVTVADFAINGPKNRKIVMLRHDIDRRPDRALAIAQLEASMGVTGTYYFRVTAEVFQPAIIEQIATLGHEIGYHYEDLATARGDCERAIALFQKNLDRLRAITPVTTICMHGSPHSRWDNRMLWKKHDYRQFGIRAEPYLDFDFRTLSYVTDTGRRWDGAGVSVRDKVPATNQPSVKTTRQLANAIRACQFQDQLMVTVHPQRWLDNRLDWFVELVKQNGKNQIKRLIVAANRDRSGTRALV